MMKRGARARCLKHINTLTAGGLLLYSKAILEAGRNYEKNISTIESQETERSRLPRAYGDQERPQSAGSPARQGP
jgi:hypothetical protein